MEDFQPKCDACMEALDKINQFLDMEEAQAKSSRARTVLPQEDEEN